MVPGLTLMDDFFTEGEERDVMGLIDSLPWQEGLARRVQHYGYTFDYSIRGINYDKPQVHIVGYALITP